MIEHIEQGTLPSGKKACLSLTSWTKRINTVGLTIFNLKCVCGPEYHIVLTLAEEEFPKKERELPKDLLLMNKAGLFEILWVKKNYKAFKKWIFCAQRYPTTPVISADDDCLYTCNYAQKLYNTWINHKMCVITNDGMPQSHYGIQWCRGPNTLYPPVLTARLPFDMLMTNFMLLNSLNVTEDDSLIGVLVNKYKIKIIDLHQPSFYIFHDAHDGLSDKPQVDFKTVLQLYQALFQ